MKAEITAEGCLVIRAENGLEAYALEKWNDGNRSEGEPVASTKCSTLKVDPSLPVEIDESEAIRND